MASTARSTNLFASEDWTKVYESFKEIDFQSYDFQTIRKAMVDYLQEFYPEDFNDYIESSEYVALIDMIAYIAQSLSFRSDLNARENFLETAERRDSILRLAKMLNYFPKRSQVSRGLLKVDSVQTTENIFDSNGNNLASTEIFWGDETNPDFLEQFTSIMNAATVRTQRFGASALKSTIAGIAVEEYNLSTVPNTVPVFNFNNTTDRIVLEPIAKGYKKLPPPVQSGLGNFINNLKLPLVAVNQLLQGQGKNALESTGRFLVNSTIGIFGLVDVADNVGLEQKQEDFGQTLAKWGVGDGFYIVLPLFGPSSIRDTTGMFMAMTTDPFNGYVTSQGESWAIPLRTAVNAIDQRSQIIDEVNALRDNSVDYYAAVRSSYYQNRKAAIMNTDDDVLTPLPLISIEFE